MTFYDAAGYLPNSNILDGPEADPFAGFSKDNIVAFGTTHTMPVNRQRFIAVAAGKNCDYLNKVQCSISFVPTSFQVSVSVRSRTITVQPLLNETSPPQDINPSGDLSFIAMRQLTAVSHESMSWDLSILGDAFNASIENYKSAHNISMDKYGSGNFSKAPGNLPGITNSMTAMIDDVLIGFASAQIMVSHETLLVPAQSYVPAVEFGEEKYVYAIFVVNIIVVLFVIAQAAVTRLWRHMPVFDCLDPRSIIVAASKGGVDIAQATSATEVDNVFVKLQQTGEKVDPLTRWPCSR